MSEAFEKAVLEAVEIEHEVCEILESGVLPGDSSDEGEGEVLR